VPAPALRPLSGRPSPTPAPSHGPLVRPLPGRDPVGHLVTGWEPHRPLGDGLVRRFVHAYASSFTMPVHLLGGRVVRRPAYVVWDLGRPAGGLFDGAMLLRPLPYLGWEDVIDDLEADLLPAASGEVMVFSPWPTPDLQARGWRLEGHPPLLLRPGGCPEPPPPPWLDLVAVDDATTLADWERVAVDGYPLDELRPAWTGALADDRLLADPSFHAWVGYADGQAVAIGTSYVAHGLNVFTLGVTLPEHRGRGAWHVLARRRLDRFATLPAMGLFSDLSRGPAEGLGFVPLARWTVWSRERVLPSAG
jgi:hypothetical protein